MSAGLALPAAVRTALADPAPDAGKAKPAPGKAAPPVGVETITKPSGDVWLAMVEPGLIVKVLVKEGAPVRVGDVLIQLDDEVRLAELESAKAEADSDTRIEAAVATLDQKKVSLERVKEAYSESVATATELDLAKLDVEIATKQLELERFVQEQSKRKVNELELRIKRTKMHSPINGTVELVAFKEGEAVDALTRVIRVVNVDPLWIDAPMPMAQAASLQKALTDGDDATVTVCFADADGRPDATSVCTGKVIHVAQVADFGTGSRVVRVEVPNPGDRPAGEHVWVWMGR